MRGLDRTGGGIWSFALVVGGAGLAACSPDPSETAGEEEIAQQIQQELDAAAVSDPATFNVVAPIRPVLKCVEKLGPNQLKAHFGFASSAATTLVLPVGFHNRFWPPPVGRGQPTSFAAGSQADVVQVPFSGFTASIWVLGNHFAIATKFSRPCPTGGGSGGSSGAGGNTPDRALCVTSNSPPTQANGPCLAQIFAAGKSTDAATINDRFIDPSFPLGRAVNLAACQSNFCSSECRIQ